MLRTLAASPRPAQRRPARPTPLEAANVRRAHQVAEHAGLQPEELTGRELRHSFVSLSSTGLPMPGGIRAAARATTPSGSPQLRDPHSTGPMSPGRPNTAGSNAAGNVSPRATASPPSYRGQPHVALRGSLTDPPDQEKPALPVIQSFGLYISRSWIGRNDGTSQDTAS